MLNWACIDRHSLLSALSYNKIISKQAILDGSVSSLSPPPPPYNIESVQFGNMRSRSQCFAVPVSLEFSLN